MTEKVAYTLPDFLTAFGISRSTFYRAVNSGKLKARKNGTSTIVTAEDAKAWLDSLPVLQPKAA
jgi:hypothetical protein